MTFDRMVFLGNGERSMAACYELHKMLESALSSISALQQDGLQGNSMDKRESARLRLEAKFYADQVYTALTGEKITSTSEIDYLSGKIKNKQSLHWWDID